MRSWLGASRTLLATLVLVAVPILSGCLTAAAGTAQATESDAKDEAKSTFAPDAELVAIFGVEGSAAAGYSYAPWGDDDDGETKDHMAKARQDGNIGDGRCEVWAYAYRSDSKPGQVFLVFVTRDGQREGTYTIDDDLEDLQPIGDYDVNSDAAADAAKKENEGIRDALESDNHWVMFALGRTEEYQNPIWLVAGGGGGSSGGSFDDWGGGGGMVMIDAVTGKIIMSHDGSSSGSQFGGWGGWESWSYRPQTV